MCVCINKTSLTFILQQLQKLPAFSPFPIMLSEGLFVWVVKDRIVWYRVKHNRIGENTSHNFLSFNNVSNALFPSHL